MFVMKEGKDGINFLNCLRCDGNIVTTKHHADYYTRELCT